MTISIKQISHTEPSDRKSLKLPALPDKVVKTSNGEFAGILAKLIVDKK